MDWRDEYDSAIAERNRLIMALTAAEKRAEAAEKRVAELEAGLAEGRATMMTYPWMAKVDQAIDGIFGLLMQAADELEGLRGRLDALEATPVETAWRPVTGDDLPEDHDEALVTVENDDGYRFVDMAEFTVGGNWWQRIDEGWRELKRVTHWRPLPPPPQSENVR